MTDITTIRVKKIKSKLGGAKSNPAYHDWIDSTRKTKNEYRGTI